MGMPYEKVAMLVAVVCAVLFTVLLGNNFIEEAPVAVIDLDNSKYSHELIQEMDASPYIDINTVFHSAVNPKALFYPSIPRGRRRITVKSRASSSSFRPCSLPLPPLA